MIAKVEQTAHWNPALFSTEAGGRIIFKAGADIENWRSYTMLSTNGGETWSAPQALPGDHPANGLVRCKPLLLSDGRLLAPNSDETGRIWLPRVDQSMDQGRSFQTLSLIPLQREDATSPDYLPGPSAIQPTLWESEPGHVHALLRTTGGAIYRSDSTNGGQTWCTAFCQIPLGESIG